LRNLQWRIALIERRPVEGAPAEENADKTPTEEPLLEESTVKRSRFRKRVRKVVFPESVMLIASSRQVDDQSGNTAVSTPTPVYEFPTVEQALREDTPGWRKEILQELSLKKIGIFELDTETVQVYCIRFVDYNEYINSL
jgi:hypothetical protein